MKIGCVSWACPVMPLCSRTLNGHWARKQPRQLALLWVNHLRKTGVELGGEETPDMQSFANLPDAHRANHRASEFVRFARALCCPRRTRRAGAPQWMALPELNVMRAVEVLKSASTARPLALAQLHPSLLRLSAPPLRRISSVEGTAALWAAASEQPKAKLSQIWVRRNQRHGSVELARRGTTLGLSL